MRWVRNTAAAIVVLVGAALLASAVRSDGSAESPAARRIYHEVCAARDAAASGRDPQATRLFLDRAHGPLHDLAADAAEVDRAAAGRLLEAKNAVETVIEERRPLAAPLDDRADETLGALRTLGEQDAEPC